MEPTTFRLRETTLSDLDAEYEEHGFPTRADYIRHIIENREVVVESTATPASSPLRDRLDDLETRLAAVENTANTETPPRPTTDDYAETTDDYGAATTDDYAESSESVDDPATGAAAADARREAAVEFVREVGKARKGDLVEELRDRYPVPGQSDDTYWRKSLRPLLQSDDRIDYRHGRHVYVFTGEDSAAE